MGQVMRSNSTGNWIKKGSHIDAAMNKANDSVLSSLFDVQQDAGERALAARYAPILLFDAHEPFFPVTAGYTILRRSGPSPSFKQGYEIELTPEGQPPASLAIEYAIWWDWDIGHLYELEHAWVYVDDEGQVVRAEASWHGDYHDMRYDGQLAVRDNRPVIYSEPGKHAFAPTPQWFRERRKRFKRSETSEMSGFGRVLMSPYYKGQVAPTPLQNMLVRSYLAQQAFEPSWDFNAFEFESGTLVPWPALADWIPIRVNDWLDRLVHQISPSSYRFLRIGHPGAAAHAPANTLSSLQKAAELGADMVAFDLCQTADGQVVLAHLPYIHDADGKIWPVRESTLAALQAVDLGGGERVPTLAEALEVCRSEQVGPYIVLKDGDAIPAIVDAIREHDLAGYSIFGSFRPDWLADLKAQVPEVQMAILFGSPHVDAVKLAQSIGATYVHPCWELSDIHAFLTPEWVARVREASLGIICCTDGQPQGIAALRRAGVDAICSDDPDCISQEVR